MTTMRIVHQALGLLLLMMVCVQVSAHDPGLSRARIQLQESALALQMEFSLQDFEALLPLELDSAGAMPAAAMQAVRQQLLSIIGDSVAVSQADVLLPAQSRELELGSDLAVRVELRYRLAGPAAISLRVPLLEKLARGHRQYLSVWDADGRLLGRHLLEDGSPTPLAAASVPNRHEVFLPYLRQGVWHIWAGIDHILFLFTLLLPAVLVYRRRQWRPLDEVRPALVGMLKIVTAFTVAHSITLALAAGGIVSLPSSLVEPLIALSVLVAALNNMRPVFPTSRWWMAFGFGLLHGFGFAGALAELGLPGGAAVTALLAFNLGVEAGQLVIVAAVFPLAISLRRTLIYRRWLFNAGSAGAAVIASVWLFERL
ncbi:MAG: HupE/UreJ family protein [Halioglobus sp.]|nr:HupE/UreJ family protein [Halioglobus sp.]